MREIKFRAWDTKGNCMVDWLTITQTAFNFNGGSLMYDLFTHRHDNMNLMQCTGLKDKDGREIYEGDIVRWFVNGDSVTAPVGFELGAFFMLEAIDKSYGKVYNDWLRGEYEVVGNIYENGELLSAKPKED